MKLFDTIANMFRIPDLRKRIFFTLALLAVYRFGGHVPTPGIDGKRLTEFFQQNSGSLFGFIDMFSGGNFRRLTIFALGIMPYITSSIILQLLTVVVPTLEKLQNLPPEGRLVIHISSNPKRWANTSNDIQVRAGDSILIPKKPNTVTVDGSVYNPTAITFKPGRNAGWYLRQAGGPTNMANRKAMFVIRADGSVVGHGGGLFTGGVDKADLVAGDMVVVPQTAAWPRRSQRFSPGWRRRNR